MTVFLSSVNICQKKLYHNIPDKSNEIVREPRGPCKPASSVRSHIPDLQTVMPHGIMSAKGRVKCPNKHLLCLHKQILIRTFDERSEPENAKRFRGSARGLGQSRRIYLMKKMFILLTILFSLSSALCGCGGDGDNPAVSDSRDVSSSRSTDQNPDDGGIHSLTDWYNSDERVQLEAAYIDYANSMGMTYFVSFTEPDTLIFNYQYVDQLDFGGAAQEQIDAAYAQSLQSVAETFAPVFTGFQEEYGIPLSLIRFVYLNADSSLITALDFTAGELPPDSSGDSSSQAYGSLQDWIDSDAAKAVIAQTNDNLSYSGIRFGLSAEDNTLIYEYYVSDSLDLSSLSGEQLTEHLNSVVESQREAILSMFGLFRDEYRVNLEAVRIVFLREDGSEPLYSLELP